MIQIDRLIRTRRKTIALIVERDGSLVVRAPWHASNRQITQFVQGKTKWIEAKQRQIRLAKPESVHKTYVDGELFLYLGELYALRIVNGSKAPLMFNECFLLRASDVSLAARLFETWYRERAFEVISARVDVLASQHMFVYHQVKITSARTRWGSCTSHNNLCFTWRLVMAPLPVVDYVVLHELAHLRVKDHSRDFWGLVGILMPDYKTHRLWLKNNGFRLDL